MTSTPMFFDPRISIEKVASSARLEDDPEEWPTVIIKEAYKQLPNLKAYELDVELDRVDAARGFAVGKMLVYPTGLAKEAAAGQDKLVTIPLIVRDREMSPLDVYSFKGKMYPLEENSIEELLFSPNTFEGVAGRDQFQGTDLSAQISPPTNSSGYGSGYSSSYDGSVQKFASDQSLWKTVLARASTDEVNQVRNLLKDEPGLRGAFFTNEKLQPLARDLFEHQEKTAASMHESLVDSLTPTVVQFVQEGKHYLVKTANHNCYSPQAKKVTRFEVEKGLSKKAMDLLLKTGHLTLVPDPVLREAPLEKTAQVVDRFGIYRTWAGGKEIEGFAVPKVIDLEGRVLESQLFVSGEHHAFQEKIAGVFERDWEGFSDAPRGVGVFLYRDGAAALCTEPVEIVHSVVIMEGKEKVACLLGRQLSTGAEIRLRFVDGLKKIASLGEGDYALPPEMSFHRVPKKSVRVLEDPESVHVFEHQKTSGVNSVKVTHHDGDFQLEGPNARLFEGQLMSIPEAEFALGALGLTGSQSRMLLKTAFEKDKARVPQTRKVTTEGDLLADHIKVASMAFGNVPKCDTWRAGALLASKKTTELCKTAEVDNPAETVDTVLALNFVTPENASLYVSYLPQLEKVSSMLAELLVASRLGMDDVREAAAKNAMTQMSAVCRGLEQIREKVT